MKIGFGLLSWLDTPEETDPSWFAELRRIGFEGVEVPLLRGEPEETRRLTHLLDAAGLERIVGTAMPPGRSPVSKTEREQKSAADHIEWVLRTAHAMGAKIVAGPVHQTLGVFSGSVATTAELSRLAEFHRRAGDIAASLGMKIAVEAVNRFEGYVFNRTEDLAKYLEELGHPAVVAEYDTFHANIEDDDMVAVVARNIRHMGCVQVSENHRGILGTGHVPWPDLFRALKHGGYNGWLTVHVSSRAVPAFAAGARVWRAPSEGRSAVCERSYEFVRRGWDTA